MSINLAYNHLQKYIERIQNNNSKEDLLRLCTELRRFLFASTILADFIDQKSSVYMFKAKEIIPKIVSLFEEIKEFADLVESLKHSQVFDRLKQKRFFPQFNFLAAGIVSDIDKLLDYETVKRLFSEQFAIQIIEQTNSATTNRFEAEIHADQFIVPLLRLCQDFVANLEHASLIYLNVHTKQKQKLLESKSSSLTKKLKSYYQDLHDVPIYNHTKEWLKFLLLSYETVSDNYSYSNTVIYSSFTKSAAIPSTIVKIIKRIVADCQEKLVLVGLNNKTQDSQKSKKEETSLGEKLENEVKEHFKLAPRPPSREQYGQASFAGRTVDFSYNFGVNGRENITLLKFDPNILLSKHGKKLLIYCLLERLHQTEKESWEFSIDKYSKKAHINHEKIIAAISNLNKWRDNEGKKILELSSRGFYEFNLYISLTVKHKIVR